MKSSEENALRTCVGCGKSKSKDHLIRFIVSPEGKLELDYRGTYPSRGAYLCPRKECFDAAEKKGNWRKSLDVARVVFEKERLFQTLLSVNRTRLLHAVGLAQKAGRLLSGADQVKEGLERGAVKLLILSEDASANTLDNFRYMADSLGVEIVQALSMEDWGAALGKKPRATLAVTDGPFARKIYHEIEIYTDLTAVKSSRTRGD